MPKPIPNVKSLHQMLRYDPDTGCLFWLARPSHLFVVPELADAWNRRFAGTRAGSVKGNGYIQVCLSGTIVLAHRVAWALYYGDWPTGKLDHLNGDRTDNRIENLRIATDLENQRNLKRRSDNTSGHCGVFWNKNTLKWTAAVSVKGRQVYLGSFQELDDAVSARLRASREFGFSARHGT